MTRVLKVLFEYTSFGSASLSVLIVPVIVITFHGVCLETNYYYCPARCRETRSFQRETDCFASLSHRNRIVADHNLSSNTYPARHCPTWTIYYLSARNYCNIKHKRGTRVNSNADKNVAPGKGRSRRNSTPLLPHPASRRRPRILFGQLFTYKRFKAPMKTLQR